MKEIREEIKKLLNKKQLKEIAIESRVPYHTLYSFVKEYTQKISDKNLEKIIRYLSSR